MPWWRDPDIAICFKKDHIWRTLPLMKTSWAQVRYGQGLLSSRSPVCDQHGSGLGSMAASCPLSSETAPGTHSAVVGWILCGKWVVGWRFQDLLEAPCLAPPASLSAFLPRARAPSRAAPTQLRAVNCPSLLCSLSHPRASGQVLGRTEPFTES